MSAVDPRRPSLREITAATVRAVCALQVAGSQTSFVAPNAVSLAEALFSAQAWYRAVCLDDEIVGFVLLYDESLGTGAVAQPRAIVWRFMVDARRQGRGIGRAALARIVEHVRRKGVFSTLLLSYVPGPGCAEPFYRRLGFQPTGRIDGGEVELSLPLEAAPLRMPAEQAATNPPLPTPTLQSARLRLRPFREADADAVFALLTDRRVMRYWNAPPWRERAQAERFIAVSAQMERDGSGGRVAIDRIADGAFIGWCGFHWNREHRSIRFGYCLDAAAWGQGFATEAAGTLLQWAFDTLDLHRVQAEVDTRNLASARVLEKLGFLREGTLREDCIVEGEISDSWVYGLLRRDWKPRQD